MSAFDDEWFDASQTLEGQRRLTSKFLRKDFGTTVGILSEKWPTWTADQKLKFTGAFSVKNTLNDEDRQVLEFLMHHGDERIWRTIALLVVHHPDRTRALGFFLTRLKEGEKPLANYYQALDVMHAIECVSVMQEMLVSHQREIDSPTRSQPSVKQFAFLDYLACSAALYKLTGSEKYLSSIKAMARHSDNNVRKTARMVADASSIRLV